MDRNICVGVRDADICMSLSARRAWIEILESQKQWLTNGVALRKESVDRNLKRSKIMKNRRKSLSARRAWIEMRMMPIPYRSAIAVALRKESVDRNNLHCVEEVSGDTSLSARRAWIEMIPLQWTI